MTIQDGSPFDNHQLVMPEQERHAWMGRLSLWLHPQPEDTLTVGWLAVMLGYTGIMSTLRQAPPPFGFYTFVRSLADWN